MTVSENVPRLTWVAQQHPPQQFGTGMLNHSEDAARDTAPAWPAPEQPVTTLVSAALGPKIPIWDGD